MVTLQQPVLVVPVVPLQQRPQKVPLWQGSCRLLAKGVRLEVVCERLGVAARTIQRWRKPETAEDRRCGPHTRPANRLSEVVRRRVLAVANSEEFRDGSPKQIVPGLADRGEYVASEASVYRVLREAGQLPHRGHTKAPSPRPRAAHTATRPQLLLSEVVDGERGRKERVGCREEMLQAVRSPAASRILARHAA
ncbi:hypothetical protein [Myxococcus faecalis]|uniref:hypothetical protein n=1 Tax=Myxococcus faecalis TaxID=3115646 RepID=UPI003CEE824E